MRSFLSPGSGSNGMALNQRNVMVLSWSSRGSGFLLTENLQGHMMYVAEITPPTENEEFLKMLPACNELFCTYRSAALESLHDDFRLESTDEYNFPTKLSPF